MTHLLGGGVNGSALNGTGASVVHMLNASEAHAHANAAAAAAAANNENINNYNKRSTSAESSMMNTVEHLHVAADQYEQDEQHERNRRHGREHNTAPVLGETGGMDEKD